MQRVAANLLKGIGLGIFIATGLTAWVLIVRSVAGTAPFARLHTSLGDVVSGYYLGGITGGSLIGICWPLKRWPIGYVILAILGVLPFYVFAPGGESSHRFLNSQNLATSLLGAFFVGGAVGIWAWTDDHPNGPSWLDILRYPRSRTVAFLWVGASLVAGTAWYLVPMWSSQWPFLLVVFAAGVLFIVPLMTALLVTFRFKKGQARAK